jgi:hypothetical protein
MFDTKVTRSPTKTAASLQDKPALRHSMFGTRPFPGGTVEQAHFLQPATGSQATLPNGDHEREVNPEGMIARDAPRSLSWDFGEIPLFPADRVNRPQTLFPPAALPSPSIIQRKLAVGEDPLERATDRAAGEVMRMSAPEPVIAPAPAQLQRKCAACEEEEPRKLRARPAASPVAGGSEAPAIVHEVLGSTGQPLDPSARALMEPRFGRDFADIRVHADTAAGESARAIGALAYASANHIVFASGQYDPHSDHGRHLLAHELAHTVQQASEPIGAQATLTIGRSDDPSERAADAAADAVLRGERAPVGSGAAAVVRRQPQGGPRDCAATKTDSSTATVKCGDREFRVTATPVTERHPATHVTATPDIDATDISLKVSICRGGTEVRILPSVNLPGAFRTAIGNAISSGSIGNVTVKPRAQITWLQSKQFEVSITGGPDIDVGSGQVTGGTVGGAVDTGGVKIGGNVILGPDGKPIGGGITIGSSTKPKAVDCHDENVVLQLSCESVTRTPGIAAVPGTDPKAVDEQLEIFFEYMSTKIREGELPSQARIDELTAQGARVVSIDGFASPEGPRKPGPEFIGNNKLSANRADTAEAWLRRHAPQLIPATYTSGSTVGQGEIGPADVNGREPAAPAQDITYPSLRKATIHLTHTIPGTPGRPATPDTSKTNSVDCPDDVKRAARKVLRNP